VLVYPGVAEAYCMMLGAHLFGLQKVSQACLELVASRWWAEVDGPTCSFSVSCHGEAFHGIGVQGHQLVLAYCYFSF
jgi:hypothetical protein